MRKFTIVVVGVLALATTGVAVGVVEGRLKVDVASGKDTALHYDAVYDHGNVAGLAHGHAHDPGVRVLANLSAGFSAAGGFTDGKLGGGTAGGSAVELGPGRCASDKPTHEEHEAAKKQK